MFFPHDDDTPGSRYWKLILSDTPEDIAHYEALAGVSQAAAIDEFIEESCWSEDLTHLVGQHGTLEERRSALRECWYRQFRLDYLERLAETEDPEEQAFLEAALDTTREDAAIEGWHLYNTEAMEEADAKDEALMAIYKQHPIVQEALAVIDRPEFWEKESVTVSIPKGLRGAFDLLRSKGLIDEGDPLEFGAWLNTEISYSAMSLVSRVENLHRSLPEFNALWNQACDDAGQADKRYEIPQPDDLF